MSSNNSFLKDGLDDVSSSSKSKNAFKSTKDMHIGTIADQIGTGDNAKDSFVWLVLKYSFFSAVGVLLLISVHNIFIYDQPVSISEATKVIWDVFTPLVTLALGYAFGKKE